MCSWATLPPLNFITTTCGSTTFRPVGGIPGSMKSIGQSCVKYMMSSSTTWSLPTVREIRSMRVIGWHLADEVVGIKIDDAGVAVTANEGGHVVHVRFRRHR